MITPTEARDYVLDILGWLIRLGILLLAIALIALIISVVAGAAECHKEQGDDGYWQWRYVKPYENRKCWYRGREVLSKEQLHWPAKQKIKYVNQNEYTELDAQADRDAFFAAKPYWPFVGFIPWQQRIERGMYESYQP